MRDERAVSDVVGFVLSFAVIIASVAVVTTAGFGQLEELRNTEQIRSAEAGMDELAESFSYVIGRSDTKRQAGLALNGGNFEVVTSELSVEASGGGMADPPDISNMLTLRHTLDGVPVVYEGGAMFYGNGHVVRHRPALSCRDDVAIVSVMTLSPTDPVYLSRGQDRVRFPGSDPTNSFNREIDLSEAEAISDEGRLTLEVRAAKTDVGIWDSLSGDTVTVTYDDTATPAGWTQLRDRRDTGWDWSGSADTNKMSCEDVDRVLVRTTQVTLTVSQ